MTISPARHYGDAQGVADFNLPLTPVTIKMRATWLRTLKSVALTRTANGDPADMSKLIREAIAMWADEHHISLDGF